MSALSVVTSASPVPLSIWKGNSKSIELSFQKFTALDEVCVMPTIVLDRQNHVVHAFDNSPDNTAIKQKYGTTWKANLHEEIPHQHDAGENLTLMPEPMNFDMFVECLQRLL
ncbi:MAG: hypothetical protein GY801_14570 [bacterium]|nr:hypothetical protein [bacterium]